MLRHRAILGKEAETQALTFLRKKGYSVIAQNYSTKFGELDIVAQHKECLCFIEVRSRSSDEFGLPEESLTYKKKKHITLAAREFIKTKHLEEPICRFDMVCVRFDEHQRLISIKIENDIIS